MTPPGKVVSSTVEVQRSRLANIREMLVPLAISVRDAAVVAFPTCIVLPIVTNDHTATLVAITSTLFLSLFAVMFLHWYWVA